MTELRQRSALTPLCVICTADAVLSQIQGCLLRKQADFEWLSPQRPPLYKRFRRVAAISAYPKDTLAVVKVFIMIIIIKKLNLHKSIDATYVDCVFLKPFVTELTTKLCRFR